MTKEAWGLIITCAAAVLAVILISLLVKKHKITKSGDIGEKKVARILKRFASVRGFKVINDIYLPLYDKTTQVDHILIGYFGMIVIETKNYKGSVYGDLKAKQWTHIVGNDKNEAYNPVLQNKAHIDCIRHIISKNNIYNVKIDSLIVFADKKAELYIPKNDFIIKINKLKRFLKQSKYEQDNGVDVERLYNCLTGAAVTDKSLISRHNHNVRKMSKNK